MWKVFILIAFSVSLMSCRGLLVTIANQKLHLTQKKPELKKFDVAGKEVFFIGMRHIGTKKYYNNTKQLVEKFSKDSFLIFVESVAHIENGVRFRDTLMLKKFRKITGVDLGIEHANQEDKVMKLLVERLKLINQPDYKELGVHVYKKADLSYVNLINLFEERYGDIELDSCDLNSKLGSQNPCKLVSSEKRQIFDREFILQERNKFVANEIQSSANRKILLIYGLMHYEGIKDELQKLQNQVKR
jgi:hypothetical protein